MLVLLFTLSSLKVQLEFTYFEIVNTNLQFREFVAILVTKSTIIKYIIEEHIVMNIHELYKAKKGTTQDALSLVSSGDTLVLGGDLSCPQAFAKSLHTIASKVENVLVFKDFTNHFDFARLPQMDGKINSAGFFFGKDMAEGMQYKNSSFFPSDLNYYVKNLLHYHKMKMLVITTSSMDENGDFQLGLCNMWEGECLDYAIEQGLKIIIEVNPRVPRVAGGQLINIKDVTMLVEVDYPFKEIPSAVPSKTEREVAKNVRSLLKDGDCIQVGIGSLPNAILNECMDLQDLGMHTEMVTTAMGQMIKKGIITGERKNYNKGEHIFTFAGGTNELFQILGENKRCRIVQASYGVDPFIIMKNDNMVSINTLIEVDLTGQICSEAVGTRQISGSGGAFNYAYGALRSKGGRGIMAFTSMTPKGQSKIVPYLKTGAPVTVPRNYIDYIVTEYGVAPMRGRTVKERVHNLISVAHPNVRKELENEARKLNYI